MISEAVDENCPIHGKHAIRKEMIIPTLPPNASKPDFSSCSSVKSSPRRPENKIEISTPTAKWSDEWQLDENESTGSSDHDEIESIPSSSLQISVEPLFPLGFDLNLEKLTLDQNSFYNANLDVATAKTASQLALANIDIEMREFELQKHRKINETLMQSLQQRDETIAALQDKVWAFEKYKQELEETREHLNKNNRAIDDIKTSLVTQNLTEKTKENSMLYAKLAEAEQVTAEKDKLIASLNKQVLQAQLDNQHLKHEIHGLQSDRQALKESMGTLANTIKGKEMQLQLSISKSHQEELKQVLEQVKGANQLVKQRDDELAKCRSLLKLAEKHFATLVDKNKQLEQSLQEKQAQVEQFKNTAIELECKLVQVDKSSQLQAALATVSKLKAKCHQLQLRLDGTKAI